MRTSTDRIHSSHGGNLPRPPGFDALLADPQANAARIAADLPGAVEWVIDRQIDCGLDIINDGEYVKAADPAAYHGYIQARITGFGSRERVGAPKRAGTGERERRDFPGFYASGLWYSGSGGAVRPGFATPGKDAFTPGTREAVCDGPIAYTGYDAIGRDIDAIRQGLRGRDGIDGFIASLGPLSLGAGATNLHYADEREYMFAVAECMREEYRAITDAGLIVQVDEPEFATTWQFFPDWSIEEYRRYLAFAVEVINHSLEGIPEEQVRFHMCWGSGHRPHTQDVPFADIADLLFTIDAQAYAFEASNPRHAHEYRVLEDVPLPDGKIIVPGVVGHYTDLVEHPELVAERLVNFARIVGMEHVHAGTDCGIGSRVGHEEIAWAKLASLADGADIASKRLRAGL
ncbi:MAG TPA: epoxyalkane--coenzyme M transferase [Microbacteriaceae bacterium]|nr:epoxyalkane--coenzyme M transferase [Microbacteriaceae bacterium]